MTRRDSLALALLGAACLAQAAEHCDAGLSQARRGAAPHSEMVWIPGGEFWMGTDHPDMDDASPVHRVFVDGFWMDRTEVTNDQFARFVAATGYVTVAERRPDPKDFPIWIQRIWPPDRWSLPRLITQSLRATLTCGGDL
jgi:formylglycine-generating enzyme required for sulfatase activity